MKRSWLRRFTIRGRVSGEDCLSPSQSGTPQVTCKSFIYLLLFKNEPFSVTYEDMVANLACEKCFCCTPCRQECGCAADEGESENELVFKILGISRWDPKLMAAQETRDRFIVEEEELNNARNGMSKDMEEQDQSSEEGSESEDAVEEEGEEDE